MSENMQCNMNVRNNLTGILTLARADLPWGKWNGNPPSNIAAGATVSFGAQGAKGSATGTSGLVTYTMPDNLTTFTINFDIPYSGSNSGTLTVNGGGASTYTVAETDDSYSGTNVSFPTSGSAPTVYYVIGSSAQWLEQSPGALTRALIAKVQAASSTVPVPLIDIATVARASDCGEVSADLLVSLFNGKTSASCVDILNADPISVSDRVSFVSNRGLISPKNEFKAAVDFMEHAASAALASDKILCDLAMATIKALRALGQAVVPPPDIDTLANEMEDAKALMLAQRNARPLLTQVAALDGILACVYMAPGAALAQAGSCARDTASDTPRRDAIAAWQLAYLLELQN